MGQFSFGALGQFTIVANTELRLNHIVELNAANNYLKNIFIPRYWNNNIVVEANNKNSEFSPVPNHINLQDVFLVKEYREIRNDHTFSYENKFYLINAPIRTSIAKQKIEIRTQRAGEFKAYFAENELAISPVTEPTKISMFDLEIQKKLDVIKRADELKNVTEAARIYGVSRQTIYKNRKILKERGPQALKRIFRKDHYHKNRASSNLEKLVLDFSLKNPHLGQAQVALQLSKLHQINISPSGVRKIWVRAEIQTMALRIYRSTTQKISQPSCK